MVFMLGESCGPDDLPIAINLSIVVSQSSGDTLLRFLDELVLFEESVENGWERERMAREIRGTSCSNRETRGSRLELAKHLRVRLKTC